MAIYTYTSNKSAQNPTSSIIIREDEAGVPTLILQMGQSADITAEELARLSDFNMTPGVGSPVVPSGPGNYSLTPEQNDALDAATSPSGSNPFVTDSVVSAQVSAYAPSSNQRVVTIALWHAVSSAATFATELDKFLSWGYETITCDQLWTYIDTKDASDLPEKPLLIAFDDGLTTQYTNAYPELVSRNMKAVMYVIPNWMDDVITYSSFGAAESTHFSWANAQTMLASGLIEFQSHTMSHFDSRLLSAAATAGGTGSGAGADFIAAKTRIEAAIPGASVNHTAYPYGQTNAVACAALETAGCRTARVVRSGVASDGSWDGKGAYSFTHAFTPKMLIPCSGANAFDYVNQANKFGLVGHQPNLLRNGDFEAGSLGWTMDGAFSIAAGEGYGGSDALKGVGAGSTVTTASELIPVGRYCSITITARIKCDAVTANAARVFLQTYTDAQGAASPTTYTTNQIQTGGTADWAEFSWDVIGDSTFSWVALKCALYNPNSGATVWFDSVKVVRNPVNPMGLAGL